MMPLQHPWSFPGPAAARRVCPHLVVAVLLLCCAIAFEDWWWCRWTAVTGTSDTPLVFSYGPQGARIVSIMASGAVIHRRRHSGLGAVARTFAAAERLSCGLFPADSNVTVDVALLADRVAEIQGCVISRCRITIYATSAATGCRQQQQDANASSSHGAAGACLLAVTVSESVISDSSVIVFVTQNDMAVVIRVTDSVVHATRAMPAGVFEGTILVDFWDGGNSQTVTNLVSALTVAIARNCSRVLSYDGVVRNSTLVAIGTMDEAAASVAASALSVLFVDMASRRVLRVSWNISNSTITALHSGTLSGNEAMALTIGGQVDLVTADVSSRSTITASSQQSQSHVLTVGGFVRNATRVNLSGESALIATSVTKAAAVLRYRGTWLDVCSNVTVLLEGASTIMAMSDVFVAYALVFHPAVETFDIAISDGSSILALSRSNSTTGNALAVFFEQRVWDGNLEVSGQSRLLASANASSQGGSFTVSAVRFGGPVRNVSVDISRGGAVTATAGSASSAVAVTFGASEGEYHEVSVQVRGRGTRVVAVAERVYAQAVMMLRSAGTGVANDVVISVADGARVEARVDRGGSFSPAAAVLFQGMACRNLTVSVSGNATVVATAPGQVAAVVMAMMTAVNGTQFLVEGESNVQAHSTGSLASAMVLEATLLLFDVTLAVTTGATVAVSASASSAGRFGASAVVFQCEVITRRVRVLIADAATVSATSVINEARAIYFASIASTRSVIVEDLTIVVSNGSAVEASVVGSGISQAMVASAIAVWSSIGGRAEALLFATVNDDGEPHLSLNRAGGVPREYRIEGGSGEGGASLAGANATIRVLGGSRVSAVTSSWLARTLYFAAPAYGVVVVVADNSTTSAEFFARSSFTTQASTAFLLYFESYMGNAFILIARHSSLSTSATTSSLVSFWNADNVTLVVRCNSTLRLDAMTSIQGHLTAIVIMEGDTLTNINIEIASGSAIRCRSTGIVDVLALQQRYGTLKLRENVTITVADGSAVSLAVNSANTMVLSRPWPVGVLRSIRVNILRNSSVTVDAIIGAVGGVPASVDTVAVVFLTTGTVERGGVAVVVAGGSRLAVRCDKLCAATVLVVADDESRLRQATLAGLDASNYPASGTTFFLVGSAIDVHYGDVSDMSLAQPTQILAFRPSLTGISLPIRFAIVLCASVVNVTARLTKASVMSNTSALAPGMQIAGGRSEGGESNPTWTVTGGTMVSAPGTGCLMLPSAPLGRDAWRIANATFRCSAVGLPYDSAAPLTENGRDDVDVNLTTLAAVPLSAWNVATPDRQALQSVCGSYLFPGVLEGGELAQCARPLSTTDTETSTDTSTTTSSATSSTSSTLTATSVTDTGNAPSTMDATPSHRQDPPTTPVPRQPRKSRTISASSRQIAMGASTLSSTPAVAPTSNNSVVVNMTNRTTATDSSDGHGADSIVESARSGLSPSMRIAASVGAVGQAVASIVSASPASANKGAIAGRTVGLFECRYQTASGGGSSSSELVFVSWDQLVWPSDGAAVGIAATVALQLIIAGITWATRASSLSATPRAALRAAHAVSMAYYGPNVAGVAVQVLALHPSVFSGLLSAAGLALQLVGLIGVAVVLGPLHSEAAAVDEASLVSVYRPLLEGVRVGDQGGARESPTTIGARRFNAVVDMGAAVLAAMVASFPYVTAEGCQAGAWALVAIAGLQLAYLMAVRPLQMVPDLMTAVALVAGNFGLAVVCAWAARSRNDTALNVVGYAAMAVTGLFYSDLLLSIVLAVKGRYCPSNRHSTSSSSLDSGGVTENGVALLRVQEETRGGGEGGGPDEEVSTHTLAKANPLSPLRDVKRL